jgi:hypothetical protein
MTIFVGIAEFERDLIRELMPAKRRRSALRGCGLSRQGVPSQQPMLSLRREEDGFFHIQPGLFMVRERSGSVRYLLTYGSGHELCFRPSVYVSGRHS